MKPVYSDFAEFHNLGAASGSKKNMYPIAFRVSAPKNYGVFLVLAAVVCAGFFLPKKNTTYAAFATIAVQNSSADNTQSIKAQHANEDGANTSYPAHGSQNPLFDHNTGQNVTTKSEAAATQNFGRKTDNDQNGANSAFEPNAKDGAKSQQDGIKKLNPGIYTDFNSPYIVKRNDTTSEIQNGVKIIRSFDYSGSYTYATPKDTGAAKTSR